MQFTMEKLFQDALLQYMMAMQNPGKWSGMLFKAVMHWHEKIKKYLWLEA
jgi:hypothetical protein